MRYKRENNKRKKIKENNDKNEEQIRKKGKLKEMRKWEKRKKK